MPLSEHLQRCYILKYAMPRQHPTSNQLRVYSAGSGTGAFRSAVEKHILHCEACREQLSDSSLTQRLSSPVMSQEAISTKTTRKSHDRVESPEMEIPEVLANNPQYQVIKELGRGGMGIVYLVKHRLTDRQEAIKLLMPSLVAQPGIKSRFIREIQSAAQLNHPNICTTFTAFEEGGSLGLVMEYISGTDLAKAVRKRGPFSFKLGIGLALQMCEGLAHAASRGVIHRDIKPANIMLTNSPQGVRVKVLDFGLARVLSAEQGTNDLTVDGRVLGTPEFMSPEQALSPSSVDQRADIYSLGCTLYYMFSGYPPFRGESTFSVLNAHMTMEPTPLHLANREIPPEVSNLIASMLAKDPAKRPSTADEVGSQFKLLLKRGTTNLDASVSAAPTDMVQSRATEGPPELPFKRLAPAELHLRAIKQRKPQGENRAIKFLYLILPSLVFASLGLYFREPLQKQLQQLFANRENAIIVDNLPSDCEIWINDQRARFERPNAHSSASIAARPGTYKLSLRRDGKILREQSLTVEPGRDVRITVDAKWLDKAIAGNQPKDSGRSSSSTTSAPTPKPEQNASPSFGRSEYQPPPTPTVIANALTAAEAALRSRKADDALQSLAPLFDESGNSKVQDFQAEAWHVKHLKRLADLVLQFNETLSSSLRNRQPMERLHFGNEAHEIVSINSTSISFQSSDALTELDTSDLPVNVEQCILDLQLDHNSQQSAALKAVGIATNRNASDFDKLGLDFLLKISLGAQAMDESFCEFMRAFASTTSAAPSALQGSSHTLTRNFAGAQGTIDALYLLPPNVPFPKQSSLLASSNTRQGVGAGAPFWNIETGEIGSRPFIEGPIWAFESSSNGRILATLGSPAAPRLRVYGLPAIPPIYQLKEMDNSRCDIALSNDGRNLAGCNLDEVFLRWNLQGKSVTGTTVAKTPVGRNNVDVIAIRPKMDVVAVASKDGDIRVWYTSDGSEKWKSTGNMTQVRALEFSRRSDRLIAMRHDGTFELRELESPHVTRAFKGHSSTLSAVGFSAKGRYFATADCYNNIRIWDTDDLALRSDFSVYHPSRIVAVTTDFTGDNVAVAFEDATIELWRSK